MHNCMESSSADPPCHYSMRKGPSPADKGPSSTSARLPSLHRSLRRTAASLLKPHTVLAVRGANVTTPKNLPERLESRSSRCAGITSTHALCLACSASLILKAASAQNSNAPHRVHPRCGVPSPCGDSSEVSVGNRCSCACAVSSRVVSLR